MASIIGGTDGVPGARFPDELMASCSGKVLAFEPAPRAHARLKDNVSANDLRQVVMMPMALGDKVRAPRPMKIRSSYRLDDIDDTEEAEIATTTLDNYLREHPAGRVSFLKIDTDGAEVSVLQGAAATLDRHRPTLLFEVGVDTLGKFGATTDMLLGLVRGQGYRFLHSGSLKPLPDVDAAVSRIQPRTTLNVVAIATDTLP